MSEIYNINNLTDEQIYNILGVTSDIKDHILEALIKSKISEYEKTDKELSAFFENIYDYFFLEEITSASLLKENQHQHHQHQQHHQQQQQQQHQQQHQQQTIEGFSDDITPSLTSNYNPAIKQTSYRTKEINTASLQQTIRYKSDVMNPLLKETITKTLTINSFDRDNKNDGSTEFSLTLSESLNNIVSLKLYSVQIPYTWYTINKNIGSNYFVLQGISPGIDDGNHNIFIDISSGNYTPTTLTEAIQKSIDVAKIEYSDISFGKTSVTYNVSTALTSFNFDIQKRYNETDYILAFPSNGWTNPNDISNSNISLAGFLGFNYINYHPFTLLSNQTQLPLSNVTATNDSTLSIYYLSSTNNYFKIVQYVPTTAGNTFNYTSYSNFINSQTIDPTTTYYQTIDISFSLAVNANYTRTQLFEDIATQIDNNQYLDHTLSSIIRVDQNVSDYVNYDYSYFELSMKLNRYTTQIYQNQKCALLFPDETNLINSRIPIWVGSNSCFHYDISVNELNNIYSETPSNIDTFTLITTPFIAFVCKKPGYDVSSNNYILSLNIPTNIPITFTDYQTSIDSAFQTAQTNSITTFNPSGDFNIINNYINLDANSHAQFSIDINKNMTDDKYFMDISNSNNFLYNTLKINNPGATTIDLSNSNVFNSTFPLQGGGYRPFNNGPIATFYLKPAYKNISNPPQSIILSGTYGTTYQTIAQLETGLNTLFSSYQDSDNQSPLTGSNISLIIDNGNVYCNLKIIVDKIITQKDYTMVISDLSRNNPQRVINYIDTSNSNYHSTTWYTNLTFQDASLNNGFIDLSQYNNNISSYTTFSGTNAIGNSIFQPYLNYPVYKQFFIVPQSSGITDPTNSNYLSYTLKNSSYTKDQLIQEINTFFNTNPFTIGSSISIIQQNGKETIKFRLNIEKTFKAYDYQIVFYSPYNILNCRKNNNLNFTTWDTCLGWILGFKKQTQYPLSNNWNYSTNSAQLTGDSVLSVFLYNSFIIVIDDYTHNHLNDGLVTIARGAQNYQENTTPTTYRSIIQPVVSTQQNYGLNQELNSQTPVQNIYSPGIYLKDVFGIIPMDTSTLTNNQIFVQIASTLQDQNRIYFGPVNIYRMGISLYTDRGQIIDLNGADWSFQMIAEQLYTPTK